MFALHKALPALFLLSVLLNRPKGNAAEVTHLARGDSHTFNLKLSLGMSGALLKDDFNRASLDRTMWQVWMQDVGIEVKQENGELRLVGTTGFSFLPPLFDALPRYHHVGVASAPFYDRDVVLVVKMRPAEGLSPSVIAGVAESRPSENLWMEAHLCGAAPDNLTSVHFGHMSGLAGSYKKGGVPLARGYTGWVLWVRNWREEAILASRSAFGDEETEFRTVRIEHCGGESRGYVSNGSTWLEIGKPQPTDHRLARVELKVYVDRRNYHVEARFDDVRLYRHPQEFLAVFALGAYGAARSDGSPMRYPRLWSESSYKKLLASQPGRVRLKVLSSDRSRLLGEAQLDGKGGTFAVLLPPDLVYPVGAHVVLYMNASVLGEADIPCDGHTNGLYPGDMYMIAENLE